MHKLTHVEAQRVISVLRETVEKITTLSYTPKKHDQNVVNSLSENRVSILFGKRFPSAAKLTSFTQQYDNVAESLKDIYQLEEGIRSSLSASTRTGKPNALSLINELKGKHGIATREFCRCVRDDQDAFDTLVDAASGLQNEELKGLLNVLSNQREISFQSLKMTVEDKEARIKLIDATSTREKEAQSDLKSLSYELKSERRNSSRDAEELQKAEDNIRNDLKHFHSNMDALIAKLESTTKKKIEDATKAHDEAFAELGQQESKLNEELEELKTSHRSAETKERHQKNKMIKALEATMEQYDQEMQQKRDELDEIEEKHRSELEELEELQEHFDRVGEELAMIAEEERVWGEKLAKEAEEDAIYDRGAAALQKLFRGIQGRKYAALIKKKSKKKGKGKGK